MIIVRYADDLVAGFEHEDDARRFLDAMRVRLEEFEYLPVIKRDRGPRMRIHDNTEVLGDL